MTSEWIIRKQISMFFSIIHFRLTLNGTDSLEYQFEQGYFMSPAKTIHPTNHAIDRFEERVLPLLPDETRTRMNDKKRIKQSLYELARRADISVDEEQILHMHVFLTIRDGPPIPLTLVINSTRKTLVTLYVSPGWVMEQSNGRTVWRRRGV